VPEHFIDATQEIKSQIINRAAEQLMDTEHDIAALLENYAQYLNVSPRVIKRFANLFRFYRFMQTANLTSKINELQEHEIAQLAILSLRWPQLPRLIQWNTETDFFTGNTTIDRAIRLDTWFQTGNKNEGPKESCKWLYDDGLFSFIGTNNIKLARYVEVGVW
jgi:ribosomal protein S15P/S13E